jgi:diguanylate cyclase (GGDEF)-like protein
MNPEQQPPADLYREIEALASRDWQLWSICALVIVVIAIGFAAFMLPNMVWASLVLHTDHRYLPQLFFGLITLIVLFNVYILDQKRNLNRARSEMLRHLMESAQAKQVAIIDPLTGVFNRRYLDEIIPREISRAARGASELSFLVIDVDNFKDVNTNCGHQGGDQYLKDLASLLKKTFRGSDTVVRLGGDEFLVVLPETGNAQAGRASERLNWEAKWWNQGTDTPYRLAFSCGVATYQQGMEIQEVLRLADRDMYRKKQAAKETAEHVDLPPSSTSNYKVYSMASVGEA